MSLSEQQLSSYKDNGFIFLPSYFSQTEIAPLRKEASLLLAREANSRILEKEGQTVRSVYGPHMVNQLFKQLTRHQRILKPVEQILNNRVYVYQTKINVKAAFGGDVWSWHQDFIFWHKEDELPDAQV
ncbi:MAG: phytanoyl-CoA dioxygenase family protein, partial [Acidobacteriota bacterium]